MYTTYTIVPEVFKILCVALPCPSGKRPASSLEAIAEAAKRKREEDEARLKQELEEMREQGARSKDSVVNDTMEFVRNIQVCVRARVFVCAHVCVCARARVCV